ncbi:MAG: cob(I)yrinic acid a,c-diamide adenosyltransferase, partial [Syntrophales bacterium]|nr:cob(I)yrinic acid a,c-diamide adenosyltransferase [Syntrophales bacterium]
KMPRGEKGLIIVHTGNGKGKTTAAMGMALRAVGHNLKVQMVQFIKGGRHYEIGQDLVSPGDSGWSPKMTVL